MARFVTSACQICKELSTGAWTRQQKGPVTGIRGMVNGTGHRGVHMSSAKLGSVGEGYHKPSDFDKKILVWTKRYADVSEVPPQVTNVQMKKAKDLFRIRVNLMMVAATVVLAGIFAWSGRRAAQQGDSVVRQNRLWHAESRAKGE